MYLLCQWQSNSTDIWTEGKFRSTQFIVNMSRNISMAIHEIILSHGHLFWRYLKIVWDIRKICPIVHVVLLSLFTAYGQDFELEERPFEYNRLDLLYEIPWFPIKHVVSALMPGFYRLNRKVNNAVWTLVALDIPNAFISISKGVMTFPRHKWKKFHSENVFQEK